MRQCLIANAQISVWILVKLLLEGLDDEIGIGDLTTVQLDVRGLTFGAGLQGVSENV